MAPATPAPVTEYVTPTPTDFYAAPARVIEYVAPAPVIEHIAPPPAATCFTLSVDTTGFVNPQFSLPSSQVVGSFPSLNKLTSLVYNQVHQEPIAAEQKSVEGVQQHTTAHR